MVNTFNYFKIPIVSFSLFMAFKVINIVIGYLIITNFIIDTTIMMDFTS